MFEFSKEIYCWFLICSIYIPLSIIVWFTYDRNTNLILAGVIALITIMILTLPYLRKINFKKILRKIHLKKIIPKKIKIPSPKMRPLKRQEIRHPEIERIPVSSLVDNIPLLRKAGKEVKNEKISSAVNSNNTTANIPSDSSS